jgi:ketosteroid isomerase-like protein
MSERELIDAAMAAWNEGGPDAFLQLLPPDIEWHAPPGFLQGEVWTDRKALGDELREQFASVFTGVKIEVLDVEQGPNGWLICARQAGTHGSGVAVEWPIFMVVQFEGDVARRIWIFFDRDEAMRQAGIDE